MGESGRLALPLNPCPGDDSYNERSCIAGPGVAAVTNTDFAVPPSPPSPTPSASGEDPRARAQRRVAALKGFYTHLTVFLLVITGLVVVDLATGPRWWVHWVFLGWGIGVLSHGLAVGGRTSKAISNWEERKTRQFMEEERQHSDRRAS
jgi:hypothetical protein